MSARATDRWSVASRFIAASLGGYALISLAQLAMTAVLPIARNEALLFTSQAGYLAWTGIIVWCFAVRSARRAWLGLAAVALPLLVASLWYLAQRGPQ